MRDESFQQTFYRLWVSEGDIGENAGNGLHVPHFESGEARVRFAVVAEFISENEDRACVILLVLQRAYLDFALTLLDQDVLQCE